MTEIPGRRVLGRVAAAVALAGLAAFAAGAALSRRETGAWIGYPVSSGTGVLLGFGLLVGGVGLVLLVACAIAALVERSGLHARLDRERGRR